MTSAETFDFAAELEVAADSGIIEHAEAVYDRNGAPGHSYDFIGVELQVGLMADGQDDGVRLFERAVQSLANPELGELLLVSEESRP